MLLPEDMPSWVAEAACAQTDPEAFFPEVGGSTRLTKRVCARCPVTEECLEHAVTNDERYGVWGGESAQARRRIRRERGLT